MVISWSKYLPLKTFKSYSIAFILDILKGSNFPKYYCKPLPLRPGILTFNSSKYPPQSKGFRDFFGISVQ